MLEQHTDIRQVVVVAREWQSETRLVAYYIANPGTAPTETALYHWAKAKLPDYMIPATFVRLEAMPLTANGKVDRQALRPPTAEFTVGLSLFAPRDELEEQLRKIWEEALGRRIGIRDNFFESGGYSVLAVKVMQRIEQECGKRLPIAALFGAPTVEQFACVFRHEQLQKEFGSDVALAGVIKEQLAELPK